MATIFMGEYVVGSSDRRSLPCVFALPNCCMRKEQAQFGRKNRKMGIPMTPHKAIRVVVALCFLAAAFSYGPPATSKTTDYSDAWSTATEDGWSVLFVQQGNTIFAAMYVYGPNGQAIWYAATLFYQGGSTPDRG
jgi:hypothetical protein